MSFPYLALTTLKYKSPHATDLSFAKGEKIRVTGPSPDDEDWLVGESLDGTKSGGFPRDFVTQIEEEEAAAAAPVAAAAPAAPANSASKEPAEPAGTTENESAPTSPVVEKSEPAATEATSTAPVMSPAEPPSSPPLPAPAPAQSPMKELKNPLPPASSPSRERNNPVLASESPSKSEQDPSRSSMKDRLAFFAAAQPKAAPPPIKPKPAGSGMTWSQRQKLKQEEEAKRLAEGGGEAAPTATTTAAASPPPKAASPPPSGSPPVSPGGTRNAMSASDAASSIGGAGSLRERMAALRNAGAFGQNQDDKPTPPKPSGKVWSRAAAPPTPEAEDVEGTSPKVEKMRSPLSEGGDALAEEGEKQQQGGDAEAEEGEEDEEAKEKARRAAIAARMAKLGGRSAMGMPTPPKPGRKPTREVSQTDTTDKAETATSPVANADDQPKVAVPAPAPAAGTPSPSTAAPTSVPIATGPRRMAPPKRKAQATTSAPPSDTATREQPPEADKRFESTDEAGRASPPPQVMVADEEKPLPKTAQQLEMEKEEMKAGEGGHGADGAKAAGIAISPTIVPKAQTPMKTSKASNIEDGAEQPESGDREIHTPAEDDETSHAPVAMVPIHPPADDEAEGEEDEEAPPPPPPRMTGLPKDEVEMKHDRDAKEAEEEEENDAEGEEEGEEEDGPPPVPSGRPSRPPPTNIPAEEEDEEEEEPKNLTEEPESGEVDEPQEEEEAEEDAPPPPPPRQPSMPVPIQTDVATAPSAPSVASPASNKSAQTKEVVDAPPADETGDEEKTRRSGIAARMAKLGGVKFGMPPRIPIKKNSMSLSSPSEPPLSPRDPETAAPPLSPIDTTVTEPALMTSQEPQSPMEASQDGEESAEAQAERKRATLARLRAQGTLGFGMFHHGPASPSAHEDTRGLEPEEAEEAPPPIPGDRPTGAPPAPPMEDDEQGDEAPPPPPSGRPTGASRELPPPPAQEETEDTPPPAPRAPRSPTIDRTSPVSPTTPGRQNSRPPVPPSADRRPSQSPSIRSNTAASVPPPSTPGQTKRGSMGPVDSPLSEEPAVMMMQGQGGPQGGAPPSPPPPPPAPGMESSQAPATPPTRRSMSSVSRGSDGGAGFTPTSRQQSRQSTGAASAGSGPTGGMPGTPRQSAQMGRPGYNDLVAASQDCGTRMVRTAKGIFGQGKKGNYGDGSPAGFVSLVMQQAQVMRHQDGLWGSVIFEQEASSTLSRYDEPRPGDIAAFFDARFKGRSGLKSYEQHVGSVHDPLLGIVIEFEGKGKHKLKVLQVERGTPGDVSYRCDDLKSGRVVVFRPGI